MADELDHKALCFLASNQHESVRVAVKKREGKLEIREKNQRGKEN